MQRLRGHQPALPEEGGREGRPLGLTKEKSSRSPKSKLPAPGRAYEKQKQKKKEIEKSRPCEKRQNTRNAPDAPTNTLNPTQDERPARNSGASRNTQPAPEASKTKRPIKSKSRNGATTLATGGRRGHARGGHSHDLGRGVGGAGGVGVVGVRHADLGVTELEVADLGLPHVRHEGHCSTRARRNRATVRFASEMTSNSSSSSLCFRADDIYTRCDVREKTRVYTRTVVCANERSPSTPAPPACLRV